MKYFVNFSRYTGVVSVVFLREEFCGDKGDYTPSSFRFIKGAPTLGCEYIRYCRRREAEKFLEVIADHEARHKFVDGRTEEFG